MFERTDDRSGRERSSTRGPTVPRLLVRLCLVTLVVLGFAVVGVGVSPAAADDCDDDDGECDDGSSGFSIIESFLAEWGNSMTAVTEGWADGGTCTSGCPEER